MQWFEVLNCSVDKATFFLLQSIVDTFGVGSDIGSPIIERTCRELRLLVTPHTDNILRPHLWRIDIISVESLVAISPKFLPRMLEPTNWSIGHRALRNIELEFGARLRNALDKYIREVVHIDHQIQYSMDSKTNGLLIVIFVVADNLQRLLYLHDYECDSLLPQTRFCTRFDQNQ